LQDEEHFNHLLVVPCLVAEQGFDLFPGFAGCQPRFVGAWDLTLPQNRFSNGMMPWNGSFRRLLRIPCLTPISMAFDEN